MNQLQICQQAISVENKSISAQCENIPGKQPRMVDCKRKLLYNRDKGSPCPNL